MPEPVREGTYKGKPTIGVLTGVGRDGTEFWKDYLSGNVKLVYKVKE